MMEAMRILKTLDIKPRRTIRIGLWSGEEEGLLGSQGYVQQHFGSRPPMDDPGMKDMPTLMRRQAGRCHGQARAGESLGLLQRRQWHRQDSRIYLQENEAVAPIFEAWMEPFKDLGMTTLTMRNTGGTDHQSFDAVGIPGFQFIQDPHRVRNPHSPLEHGRLRPPAARRSQTDAA
jgi:carboxypeptidase Q